MRCRLSIPKQIHSMQIRSTRIFGSSSAMPTLNSLRCRRNTARVSGGSLNCVRTSTRLRVVETDFKKLNRDYGVVESRHQELLRRWETLQSKKRLDPVTDKVQFNILEPPFAMATPVAPNRPLLLVAVLVFALGAGGAVAFGLNQLKPVFFNRRTLSRVAGLPVLGSISMIMSPDEIAARHRKTVAWTGANLALLVLGTVVIALENPISRVLRDLTGSGF